MDQSTRHYVPPHTLSGQGEGQSLQVISLCSTMAHQVSSIFFFFLSILIYLLVYSPYCVGSKLWNDLQISDTEMPDIFSFKQTIKRKNRMYVDLIL